MMRITDVLGRLAPLLVRLAMVFLWVVTGLWFYYAMYKWLWKSLIASTTIGSALGYLILLGLGMTISFFIVLFVGAISYDVIFPSEKEESK